MGRHSRRADGSRGVCSEELQWPEFKGATGLFLTRCAEVRLTVFAGKHGHAPRWLPSAQGEEVPWPEKYCKIAEKHFTLRTLRNARLHRH